MLKSLPDSAQKTGNSDFLVRVFIRSLVFLGGIAGFFSGTSCAQLHADPSRNASPEATRTSRGLVVLYQFDEEAGSPTIRDTSGYGPPLQLKIKNPEAVKHESGAIQIVQATSISSSSSNRFLSQTVNRGGALTIEAWIQPENLTQKGPARIISFSQDSSRRNFTLGQDGNRFDFRLRTSKTDQNGLPSTSSSKNSVTTKPTHVVAVRRRSGQVQLFVDGKLETTSQVGGSFANWQADFALRLGDEGGGGRLWKGTFFLVAIFDRGLTAAEIANHYQLGPHATSLPREAPVKPDLFADAVAPLLSEHCLECHDAPTRQGGLDLSHRIAALQGGDSGQVIVKGDPNKSLLYQSVLTDSMPHDRAPLTSEDKDLLRRWIQSGADWSLEFIDPALYQHSGGARQLWIQRLTQTEYVATVRTTLGVELDQASQAMLPVDLRADGFSNTAYNLNVDLKHIEAYARLAEIITTQMDVGDFAKRFSKRRKFTDKDIGEIIERMGKWVLRGPLTQDEIILYRGISTTVASSGGDFDQALELILQAMLQSPRFLYRIENQQGDGFPSAVDRYELASRISYILWGSSPDRELFEAADEGRLSEPDVLREQVVRMLEDPRAVSRAEQFVNDWLNLDALNHLRPNAERFPKWSPQLASDMQSETRQFFVHVALEENRPLHELLLAQTTFVSRALADHYQLSGAELDDQAGLLQVDLSSDPNRGGILTQGSVLTMGGDDASTVTRGLFVLHDLLRGVVQDPPPCVDTTPIPTEPGLTQRMIANRRIENESCGGCHSKFEPLAFGLGKFDGLGAYVETDEHGNRLRDDGNVLVPGEAEPRPFANSSELMKLLAMNPRVQESLTWKLVQFALGRPLHSKDAITLMQIHERSMQNGGTYRSLMMALIESKLVQQTQTESVDFSMEAP